ncbi:MAG: ROK family protein [Clostridia bacterium]|nr:ROK family protein [Clostridia bacterium]
MYNIGIDLGGTNIATGIIDENCKMVAKISVPTLSERDFSEIVKDMAESINKLLKDNNISIDEVNSIGMGIPGTLNSEEGLIVYSNNIPINNIPVVKMIKEYFDKPVYISNDANCAALGEVYAGAAKGRKNVIMITLGTGVGGGIIIDGKLYEGTASAGAELGHTILVLNGEQCTCGRKGCVEAYASATGLIRETKKAIEANPDKTSMTKNLSEVNGRTAFDAAKAGDEVAIKVIDNYIMALGELLVDMTNIFRPEIILLSGGISHEGDNLYVPLKEYVQKNSYGNQYNKIPLIERATLGNDAGIFGAAMLYNGAEKKNEKYPVKTAPVFKDYLWGGNNLTKKWNKNSPYEITAESWELSAHKNGQSTAVNGIYKGKTLSEIIEILGTDAIGTAYKGKDFPLLIKLIDAKNKLSIQVHPDDAYAKENENQFGKTEMWYIVEAEEGAGILLGFNKDITKEEFEQRIKENTLLEVLNFVPCKAGDSVFIPPKTIHAIGEGLLIAEIQQNSDVTYRVYDYDRVGADGKKRELHVEKSIEVSNLKKLVPNTKPSGETQQFDGFTKTLLETCEYFTVYRYESEKEVAITANEESFVSVLFLSGEGYIECNGEKTDFQKGDSFFIPAGTGKFTVNGCCSFVESRI